MSGTTSELVLIIPKDYEKSLNQGIEFDDPSASVTITYIYDPSSSSVSVKMQILNAVFAYVNQGLSGKPPFIRTAETSILTKKYRFIEFFVPGIIAMAVMTLSLFSTVDSETELRQKGIIRSYPPPPSPVPTGYCRTSCTSSYSRSYARLPCCW